MIQPVSIFGPLTQADFDKVNAFMPYIGVHWNIQPQLTWQRPTGAWSLWMLGEADVAGDLAYHTDPKGVPVASVFATTVARYQADLADTIIHELAEMAADPTAATILPWPGGSIVKEICDPVSEDHRTDGCNFIYPSWFNSGPGPWDFFGLCTRPGEIRPGGYIEQNIGGRWQLTAMRKEGRLSWRLGQHGRLAYRAINAH